MEHKEAKSYGIIPVYQNAEGNYLIPVVKNKLGHWGLPKGTPEEGETPLQAAHRETFEETGVKDIKVINHDAIEEKYSFELHGVFYDKTNHYYFGFIDEIPDSSKIDSLDIKWVDINEASDYLTHEAVKNVVTELRRRIKNGQ
jgi:8-oxo-dGTP pyrophosphatase MutT (NUDIX family)